MEDQVARFSAIGIPSIATKGRYNLESVSLGGCAEKEQRDSSAWASIARYGSMCPSCDIAQSPPKIMHSLQTQPSAASAQLAEVVAG